MNIYLASPYSSPDVYIREERFREACRYAAKLMAEGHNVFSPIAHSHPVSLHMDNSMDHDFWLKQDLSFLERWADKMVVLCLPGWDESRGIAVEQFRAIELGIPVDKIVP